jgi:hypothetical protein
MKTETKLGADFALPTYQKGGAIVPYVPPMGQAKAPASSNVGKAPPPINQGGGGGGGGGGGLFQTGASACPPPCPPFLIPLAAAGLFSIVAVVLGR